MLVASSVNNMSATTLFGQTVLQHPQSPPTQGFHIVYSVCGRNRLEELLRSITSLILLGTLGQPAVQPTLHIHILSDGAVRVGSLPRASNTQYHVHQPALKAAVLFAPCSTQRLYLHEHPAFRDIDRALYIDIDTLWLGPPHAVWQHFNKMEAGDALFGMTEETTLMNEQGSWYAGGFGKELPFFGSRGLNAGILLLSLNRLRGSGFNRERDRIVRHFNAKKALPLGDQDVLNAYAHKFPHHVYVLPCTLNFRSDSACYEGFPVILHGNRGLKNDANSTYSSLYSLFGEAGRLLIS